MVFQKKCFLKIVLFEIARKTQILRLLRGILYQNEIFWVQNVFQIMPFKNIFFFKILLFEEISFSSKSCLPIKYIPSKPDES